MRKQNKTKNEKKRINNQNRKIIHRNGLTVLKNIYIYTYFTIEIDYNHVLSEDKKHALATSI